ncbi:MAG: peptide deformylase [Flavobacteriaceae bacterium]
MYSSLSVFTKNDFFSIESINFVLEQMPMILPIVAYGDPVLKREAQEIEDSYPNLDKLIENMFETMYEAAGVGLAAPQIGESIRLFIVDGSPFAEPEEDGGIDPRAVGLDDFKKVFINPVIEEENGEEWGFNEGCLSIPEIREEVYRKERVTVSYYNEKWELKEEEFDGYAARIVQHEYDHVDGVLFTDRISPLKKRLLSKKLGNISKGDIKVSYRMRFPLRKKQR